MVTVTELEMAASNTFSSILNQIQMSNLNFSINMTPFAAYITLKKTVQKNMNGVHAIPAPPLLLLLQQTQEENRCLQIENFKIKTDFDILEKKYDSVVHENIEHIEYIEETKIAIEGLTNTNENLQFKIDKAEKDTKRIIGEKAEHEFKLKENKKKHAAELKDLEGQIKDLKTAVKGKEKETYDLKRGLENAREKIKSVKAERSHLKTVKTRLETEIRKQESVKKKEIRKVTAKAIETRDIDINANKTESVVLVSVPGLPGSIFMPSMISHCNPNLVEVPQRPANITSMIAHCTLSPPPGTNLLSIPEALEALNKAMKELLQSMKW